MTWWMWLLVGLTAWLLVALFVVSLARAAGRADRWTEQQRQREDDDE